MRTARLLNILIISGIVLVLLKTILCKLVLENRRKIHRSYQTFTFVSVAILIFKKHSYFSKST